ncbi:MAG: SCO family protein [Alphaproteobacteria bacterium]|nr:SCO family protein [Alphaproteobacteria bacterium]MCB9928243.1 SCO family protein [Alphaproteobacteria bacterium]
MSGQSLPWNRIALVLAIVLAMLVALLLGYAYVRTDGGSFSDSGKALIGGPFELVDQDGRTRTDKDFLGQNLLIYFGYTFCPDVCPTELSKIAAAMDLLPEDANVTPIFITIDPERDTPAQMKAYVSAFHPRMVGLTGTPEQVAAAAKAYRVYFAKNTSGGTTEYTMDHTSIIYFMDTKGEFVTHFTSDATPEAIAKRVREAL